MSVTANLWGFVPLSEEVFALEVDDAGLRRRPTSPGSHPLRSAGFPEADGRELDHR